MVDLNFLDEELDFLGLEDAPQIADFPSPDEFEDIPKPELTPEGRKTREHLHGYQDRCVRFIDENPYSMLWLQMGLGKTIISLTSIVDRIRDGSVKKVLIWGPLRVVESVWGEESRGWEHTKHLRFSSITGGEKRRVRALFADADIYLCNYENMNWLTEQLLHYYVDQKKRIPFDMVVYDEVSKMKNSQSMRFKGGKLDRRTADGRTVTIQKFGWKKVFGQIPIRVGLTGTPASNGYIDLFGQYLAVDGGERLGTGVTYFRNEYFVRGYNGFGYEPTDYGTKIIQGKISDITIKMDAADYVTMPTVVEKDVFVELPLKARKIYENVEREMFAELDSGSSILAANAASMYNKCLQVSNGSVYLSSSSELEEVAEHTRSKASEWEKVHDAKLDALGEVLEEAAGQPVLCSYSFKPDAERIMKKYRNKYKCVNLTAAPARETGKIIKRWRDGKIQLLIGHPASMGHGVDGLQKAGRIVVWFGLNWSLELYEQMNSRIIRQGQKEGTVSLVRILCENTVDSVVASALSRKIGDQEGLKKAIGEYRKNRR